MIKNIKIERAEGRVEECIAVTVPTFAEAENVLNRWSRTAPKNGGYDKCDFYVNFEDGSTYSGRYDLSYNRADQDQPTLKGHIVAHCRFFAGQYTADDLRSTDFKSVDQYHEFLKRIKADTANYANFLKESGINEAN